MSRTPLLSVVIPTYNEREALLRQAVESVLAQTMADLELIVVDDGSTDSTPETLAAYAAADPRVRVLRRERASTYRSVSEAFTLGLLAARGQWWHHEAADCYLEAEWAERAFEYLKGREDRHLGLHTDFYLHHYDGRVELVRVEDRWEAERSYAENYRLHEALGGTLLRMDVAKAAGAWDPRFPRKQTREWTLRVLSAGVAAGLDLAYLPRPLWHFLYHEADQLKRKASIKYRLLADLKCGVDPRHSLAIAGQSEQNAWAAAAAFREFFTDPAWILERATGLAAEKLAAIAGVCRAEASEPWDGGGGGRP